MKKDKAAKPLNYMQNLNSLVGLFEKAKVLTELNQQISKYLDIKLQNYCKLANVIDNRLVFLTANSSIATELRLESANLLQKFKQDPILKKFNYIHCKVNSSPSLNRGSLRKNKMSPMSQKTSETMQAIADSIKDPKLREIMLRIATRTGGKR